MTVLIDSDILIEVSRDRDARIRAAWSRLRDSDAVLLCSPVTIAELWHGARPQDHDLLARLFDNFLCIPIDQAIGRRAGEFLRLYAKSHGVDFGDALIAAAASLNEAQLWTRNRKHYPMGDLTFFRH